MKSRTIRVDMLARVEGEGALHVRIRDGRVSDVKLKIFEPPRFFEAFLRGRDFREVPDITARICGICPIAYQVGSIQALEAALGVTPTPAMRNLRRLIYCGEWIESHVLHVAMLHAPDFLGYEDALRMAQDHPDIVKMALRLKKLGNDILTRIGGREIHPVNLKVGGFYRSPSRAELEPLRAELDWGVEAARGLVRWTATLPIPEFERDYEFVALRHDVDYPIHEGRLVSNRGLDVGLDRFEQVFVEEQVEHSHALHATIRDRGAYAVGPLARYSLNFDRLPPDVQAEARAAGLSEVCRNPFRSIVVRAVEALYACIEARRLLESYEPPDPPELAVITRAGEGAGCTEAPRGICYHRYRIDDRGLVVDARIIPPTSQNQKTIEDDLREFVPGHLELDDERLTWKCEQAVRNYDPCISCATHFLKLTVERE